MSSHVGEASSEVKKIHLLFIVFITPFLRFITMLGFIPNHVGALPFSDSKVAIVSQKDGGEKDRVLF